MRNLVAAILLSVCPLLAITDPELPRVYINTAYPAITGSTFTLHSGDDLQAAINSATCGDQIVLDAGVKWIGNYTIPHRACTGYTVIRSSGTCPVSQGTRIQPSNVSSLATISSNTVAPAVDDLDSANYWWFSCIEITQEATGGNTSFGTLFSYQHNGNEIPSNQPDHIILDRVYLHGNPTCGCKFGARFNGTYQAAVDSYISDYHIVGQEAQAITGYSGTGPYKIVNNFLEGAGENIIWGGADPSDRTVVPSDFEIKRNHFFKPLSWKTDDPSYAGTHWNVKNILEFKLGIRLLIDGNIFENCWADGQDGIAVSLKSANQNNGVGCPQCQTADVTFTNNIIMNAGQGILFDGQEVGGASVAHNPPESPVLSARIKVSNVLIWLNPPFGFNNNHIFAYNTNDMGFGLNFHNTSDVQIIHVTALFGSSINTTPTETGADWLIRDSVIGRVTYGFGVGSSEGLHGYNGSSCGASCQFLSYWYTPYTWTKVFIINGDPMTWANSAIAAAYPAGADTTVVTDYSGMGFLNFAGGATDYHGYALSSMSPGHNAASDGTDVGVDFAALDTAINGIPPSFSGVRISGGIRIYAPSRQ